MFLPRIFINTEETTFKEFDLILDFSKEYDENLIK